MNENNYNFNNKLCFVLNTFPQNFAIIVCERQSKTLNSFKRSITFDNINSNGGMPAATMFSKFKSGTATPQNPIDTNPIVQYFEIGKHTASAGPELVWKIHDAYKKSDGRVSKITLQLYCYLFVWLCVFYLLISSCEILYSNSCITLPFFAHI